MQIEEAISRAQELYYLAAIRMFRFIRAGMTISEKSR
jgi:glycerate kinase